SNSDTYGPDTIIIQKTGSGIQVPFGTRIDLVISNGGSSQVKVPQMIGMKYDEAIKSLSESRLTTGALSFVQNETYLPGTVVNQSPSAGELVNVGTVINLTITR
ncbi:MAG: PASTA domain-containing protein, partial [Ignavibacteria bacterium]|nr:PASTA domain-containing protein [Ignavibacteria bacterium]